MQSKFGFSLILTFLAAAGGMPGVAGGVPAAAADPCAGFKWDVSKERALFNGPATSLTAGRDAASAPSIGADRLYRMQLVPQDQVAFALPPGKKMLTDGAFAGLAALDLERPGDYRVSLDVPFWIDVVADGKLAATKDFQGQQSCDAPHKIVEFDLTGATHFVLQLSGSVKATVRLTVTRAPAPH
ncbi:MAG: hypothetical protein JWN43_3540 [Gammaproteobacteria bacterium]|nr:hypothetical protein [Gammaproteobacteria bacterium]